MKRLWPLYGVITPMSITPPGSEPPRTSATAAEITWRASFSLMYEVPLRPSGALRCVPELVNATGRRRSGQLKPCGASRSHGRTPLLSCPA